MTHGLTINEMVHESHECAKEKGWWGDDGTEDRPFLEQLFLMGSELSEAGEEWRNGKPVDEVWHDGAKPMGVPIELADVIIRIADTCGRYGIDIDAAIREKLAYNRTRSHRHGGKLA